MIGCYIFTAIVVVCTDLSGREPHRWVGLVRVVTAGNLGGVIVCRMANNARDMGSIPMLGSIPFSFSDDISKFDHNNGIAQIQVNLPVGDRWRCDATWALEVTYQCLFI